MTRPSGSGLLVLVTVAVAAPPDRWSGYSFRHPRYARVLLISSCAGTTTGPPGVRWPPPTLWPSTRQVRFCLRRQRALEQAAPATSAPYRRDELAGWRRPRPGRTARIDHARRRVPAVSGRATLEESVNRGRPQRCCCNEASGRAASTATAEADSAIMGCPCRHPRTWRYWRAQDEAILASWSPVPVCGHRPGAWLSAGVRRGGLREPRLCRR